MSSCYIACFTLLSNFSRLALYKLILLQPIISVMHFADVALPSFERKELFKKLQNV